MSWILKGRAAKCYGWVAFTNLKLRHYYHEETLVFTLYPDYGDLSSKPYTAILW